MKLPYAEPDPSGSDRARHTKRYRDLATEISRLTPQAKTLSNGEEADHSPRYPANFTKGLLHDEFGLLKYSAHYQCFVEAINSPDQTLFEKSVPTAKSEGVKYHCLKKTTCCGKEDIEWRGWESPRAGHVYELQGPDAGAVGMAPAPRVGSSELAAEMAEVYALALLRDVRFTDLCEGKAAKLCEHKSGNAVLSAKKVVELIADMPFYSGKNVQSSTPHNTDHDGYNGFERHRRVARTIGSKTGALTPEIAFRGSTKGAQTGPYISQFLLIGAGSLACSDNSASGFPGTDASWSLQDGFIPYGSLSIDQRTLSHKNCLDYMTDWCPWLDVQNGANVTGADQFEAKRRFITTPRDLATYVHYDALYEAYLNACLILLAMKVPHSKGFPEPSPSGNRTAFATFGGPHVLSLVCEVATRCLKAVRRQKFNYHRRARPEALGGRLTLSCIKEGVAGQLGCTKGAFEDNLKEIPQALQDAIIKHNLQQNKQAAKRNIHCNKTCPLPGGTKRPKFDACNLLLPMAFPEGSPMHPAYGAGHATVAGGCITILKAFFEMFEDCNSFKERELSVDEWGRHSENGMQVAYVPNADGSRLIKDSKTKKALTIQGELDKLAANISIGRNMAGVHYYSDYYDSLRMGERIAVGMLMEQAPSYGESMTMTFKSFDGDLITISGEGNSCPSLTVMDSNGDSQYADDWWLRHVSGAEYSEDL